MLNSAVNTGKGLDLTLNSAPVKGLDQMKTKRLKGCRSSHLTVVFSADAQDDDPVLKSCSFMALKVEAKYLAPYYIFSQKASIFS